MALLRVRELSTPILVLLLCYRRYMRFKYIHSIISLITKNVKEIFYIKEAK